VGSIRVSITALAALARELKSTDDDNPEYDRALVELVNRDSGLPDSMLVRTANTLGIDSQPFLDAARIDAQKIAHPEPEHDVEFRRDEWQIEVGDGKTLLGYHEWLAANAEPVPTEITLKFVLDLMPDDAVDIAVHDYFAEHGIPEPVSVDPLG
jgi:hypothetical protein